MKHFVKELDHYKRDYDLLGTYVEDQASHMHLMTGQPLEVCRDFVRKTIGPGGRRELVIPVAHVLVRNKFGDRERKAIPFDRLLADIREKREILSPSLTAYTHPDERVSILAEYIQGNLKKRKEAKHAKFVAEMKGEAVLAAIFEAAQTTLKIKNNSLSGAQCSPYTVLWNKSAHSTLTSTCRTATSYGNANNEKFLMGNRHYWSPEITKANIISIINHSDYEAIARTMQRHGLKAPTVEQTMACITRSTEFYWRSPKAMEAIQELVSNLSDLQRSAFVFTSDLYHLAQVNPEFVRAFFTRMSIRSTENLLVPDADFYVNEQDDNLRAFVSMLCARQLRGGNMQEALVRALVYPFGVPEQVLDDADRYYDLNVAEKMSGFISMLRGKRKEEAVEKLKKECRELWKILYWERHGLEEAKVKKYRGNFPVSDGTEANDYAIIGAMTQQVMYALDGYEDLIQSFWTTPNLPASVYYMPSIIRRTAITSDTDSTIFTVQYWTEWYVGKLDFTDTSIAVANTAVYLAGQLIRHILATFSANMGVAQKDLNRLSMKNEYYFPVFVLTARAKHYFAYISAQEGNVFKEMKMEIKGVGLRNSNVPPRLTKASHKLMRHLMDSVMAGEAISIKQVLRYIAKKEIEIRDSVFSGKFDYLKSMNIKLRESYSETAKSTNYDHYLLWESVFAPKYGSAGAPPYRAIKIPMETDSPAKMKTWLDSIKDRSIAKRMEEYLKLKGKKSGMKQLMLPETIVGSIGIPEEMLGAVNIRGTIAQVMEGFYIILECLGYYRANDYNTKLVSDDEWLLDPEWEFGELNLD